jgi:molecular chaperone DnaK (HSP70)
MAARQWKIGIDFGSTNSSAAFCLVSGPANGAKLQHIYPVQCSHHIPGRSMDEMSEFPTMLVYEGSTPIVHWGLNAWIIVKKIRANHIDPEQQIHVFESFKPLLQDECASSVFKERLAVLPFHKSLEDLITDYLTGLLHATKDQMMGCGYIEGDFVQFICTVPAMWTERAKQTTLASSERAQNNCKFTNGSASLCFEPVAAAAYVFQVDQSVDLEVRNFDNYC